MHSLCTAYEQPLNNNIAEFTDSKYVHIILEFSWETKTKLTQVAMTTNNAFAFYNKIVHNFFKKISASIWTNTNNFCAH